MRVRALVIRIVRQFVRDKRTMALLIAAPLLVLTMMYLVFSGDKYEPKVGVVAIPAPFQAKLETSGMEIVAFGSIEEAENALAERKIDAYAAIRDGKPLIKLEGSDPGKNKSILLLFGQTMQDETQAGSAGILPEPSVGYLHGGSEMTAFDSLGPVFIGVFAFFFVFLIAGVSFLKERTSGTLERLLATPLRRWEIVVGYILGFGLFTGIQAVLIAAYSIHGLGLMMEGSIWLVLLVTLLLSVTALSFGTFLSAFAKSEFQMIQFIPLVIVPQVFFSGLFDLESMSPALRWISHLMPLKYGADALRSVMIRGEGWSVIDDDVFLLLALSLAFMAANVLALRKHRKI
ncbi:ABC transporter permease [Paenibacillus soyae]|uniref:ABC transporter permease n=1 Tax=Paenibacillus soyae TaxID=2969249 RepID=A0A9X2SCS8_9BACL|nr:ABC transporter permease [Paenibacillus soyae]MCR2806467.1 ABC transporter permease [Paenibacillus soyae]